MTGLKLFSLTPLMAAIELPAGAEKYTLVGALIVAVGALYLDSKAERKASAKREREMTVALTSVAEGQRVVAGVMVEVKDTLKECRKWDGITERRKS